jgi:hypothetical protein
MASITGLVESVERTESISRDLRPPGRKIRQGLTIITEGSTIINEWRRLADEASEEIESSEAE